VSVFFQVFGYVLVEGAAGNACNGCNTALAPTLTPFYRLPPVKAESSADLTALLRAMRRRMTIRLFLDSAAAAALLGAAALVLAGAVARFGPGLAPVDLRFVAIVAIGAVSFGLIVALAKRRPLPEVAGCVDRLGGTKDRLVTALALTGTTEPSPLGALAREECLVYTAERDFRSLVPLHPPRAGAWLVVPAVALTLLHIDFARELAAARLAADEAQASIAEDVSRIDQLAARADAAAARTNDEAIRELAEQLRQSSARLRAETNRGEAQKSALRELSALEEMMKEIQRQPVPEEEMKALAKALAPMPGMQDVLNALNQGDIAEAQRAMDRAMRQEKQETGDKEQALTEAQTQQAIQDAVQGLSDRRRLSQALQRLAEQMGKQDSGTAAHNAMKQLQQMLQRAAQGNGGQGTQTQGGRQMTLQELIAALENMKAGDSPGGQQGSNADFPGGGPQISMQSFGSANPDGTPQGGEAGRNPSGRAGSERDFGTTETPFGTRTPQQDKGGELALKGQLNPGETLSMMLPSTGDTSKSARKFKELYEAMAPAAEDAVQQENIPLGSRFLVRRYFEAIRPKE
jgi:hypothetical protein